MITVADRREKQARSSSRTGKTKCREYWNSQGVVRSLRTTSSPQEKGLGAVPSPVCSPLYKKIK